MLSVSCLASHAQKFVWDADFDYKFDNREYASMKNPYTSATYFSVRLTPEIGLEWGKGMKRHRIMAGADVIIDFGTNSQRIPEMVLYYNYIRRGDATTFGVWAGRFPRTNMIGTYSNAFFSEYVTYYDSNLDGLLINYAGHNGYVELVCDWNSMYAADRREKFMIFSSGLLNRGRLYGGYNFSMFHHSVSGTEKGVVDNLLIYPYIGFDMSYWPTLFPTLYIQAGWLQAFQNDRVYVGKYVTPGGFQLEARAETRWGFGVYETLYLGGNLMPYYYSTLPDQPVYGDGLYFGEPFYRTEDGIYNRLEIYWKRNFTSDISLKISSVHHYDGNSWGWQQLLELQVKISDRMFKHRRPRE